MPEERIYEIPQTMQCFWRDLQVRYDPKYINMKACERCTGMDELCRFYMPCVEMKEIFARN